MNEKPITRTDDQMDEDINESIDGIEQQMQCESNINDNNTEDNKTGKHMQ